MSYHLKTKTIDNEYKQNDYGYRHPCLCQCGQHLKLRHIRRHRRVVWKWLRRFLEGRFCWRIWGSWKMVWNRLCGFLGKWFCRFLDRRLTSFFHRWYTRVLHRNSSWRIRVLRYTICINYHHWKWIRSIRLVCKWRLWCVWRHGRLVFGRLCRLFRKWLRRILGGRFRRLLGSRFRWILGEPSRAFRRTLVWRRYSRTYSWVLFRAEKRVPAT